MSVIATPTEKVEYEVWERNLKTGGIAVYRSGLIYSVAQNWAKQFTKEIVEAGLPGFEYFAVRATTTYEEIS